MVIAVISLPMAALMPPGVAVIAAIIAGSLQIAYTFTIFPETAPSRRASSTPLPNLCEVIKNGFLILGRHSYLTRMVWVLVLSGLSGAGMGTIFSPYATGYLGIDKKGLVSLFCLCGINVMLWLGVFLKKAVDYFGEVGVLRMSLAISTFYPTLIPLCPNAFHFGFFMVVISGALALQFPVISAIKSNLVSNEEQGVVQGALAAVRTLAVAVSDAAFGWLYRVSTHSGTGTRLSALPPLVLIACLSGVALGIAWSLPDMLPLPPGRRHDHTDGGAEVEILELGGSKSSSSASSTPSPFSK
jgi:hypothetical protein